ncbi:MAG: hypothetical protein II326_04000, partial [Clostridia bacterium]|nr:hypothetical protein [Clostridia bacterium]
GWRNKTKKVGRAVLTVSADPFLLMPQNAEQHNIYSIAWFLAFVNRFLCVFTNFRYLHKKIL